MKKIFHQSIAAAAVLLLLGSCNKKPDYDATGIFEATTVTVSAETAGKILEFNPVEGDSLIKDQPVVVIDTVLLKLEGAVLSDQQASLNTSEPDVSVQISSLQTAISHQQNEVARYKRLLADGAIPQKTVDDAEAHLRELQGQLSAAQSSLNKNRSSLASNASAVGVKGQQVREEIHRSVVKSPITGTMLEKYAQAGEVAAPGKPLFQVADLDQVYLRSYFTADQLPKLKIGGKVKVIADFGGDQQYEYPGTITWISQQSEFTPKSIQTKDTRANLVYAVKIAVKNDGRLKLGQYGEVKL